MFVAPGRQDWRFQSCRLVGSCLDVGDYEMQVMQSVLEGQGGQGVSPYKQFPRASHYAIFAQSLHALHTAGLKALGFSAADRPLLSARDRK